MNGRVIDLNNAIDLTNRNMVAAFNFREIVDEYYLRILHKSSLRTRLQDLISTNIQCFALVTVEIVAYNPSKLGGYWHEVFVLNKRFRKDYFFVVDLDLDPAKTNELLGEQLPFNKGGRIIAYKKSNKKPQLYSTSLFSRAEMERRFIEEMAKLKLEQPDLFQ